MEKREFLLQTVKSTLIDLGYNETVNALSHEIQRKSSTALIEDHGQGQSDELYDQIMKDPTKEDNIKALEHMISNGGSETDNSTYKAILYYLKRTKFLYSIVDMSFDGYNQREQLFRILKHEMLPLLDNMSQYKANELKLLNKEKESAVLLPLLMQLPIPLESLAIVLFVGDVLSIEAEVAKKAANYIQQAINTSTITMNIIKDQLNLVLSRQLAPLFGKTPLYKEFPPNYLEKLIDQAGLYQRSISKYYLPPRRAYSDSIPYSVDFVVPIQSEIDAKYKQSFPDKLLYSLPEHEDEVWFVKFSPSGKYLVTGSLSGKLIIYDVLNNFKVLSILVSDKSSEDEAFAIDSNSCEQNKAIIYCCWDFSETYIVSCGLDTVINVWDVSLITQRNDKITRSMGNSLKANLVSNFTLGDGIRVWSCEFLPGSRTRFVVGSPDKILKIFDVSGSELFDFFPETFDSDNEDQINVDTEMNVDTSRTLDRSSVHEVNSSASVIKCSISGQNGFNRVNDLAITPDGKYLITANNDKSTHIYTIPDLNDVNSKSSVIARINFNNKLNSCSISTNGKYVLFSFAPEELQVWDISNLSSDSKPILAKRLIGHSSGPYVIRSAFGYCCNENEELVLSGSEEGYTYMWKLYSGELITRVKTHHGLCNSVDWNRAFKVKESGKDYGLLWCSVGDDKLVNIWGPRDWDQEIGSKNL